MNDHRELSEQANAVYRAAEFFAKTANAGAPHQLVGAQADVLARAARRLSQMCEAIKDGVFTVHVDTVLPEGIQKLHSELFGDHVEGTLPDTIPKDWTEES